MANANQSQTAGHWQSAEEHGTESTTGRFAGAAHEAIDQAAARAEALEEGVRERAADARDSVEATGNAAAERVDESIATVAGFVRQRPVAAVGIAFAIGAVAAAVLRR